MIERKQALRRTLREAYSGLSSESQMAADERLITRLMGHDLYKNADRLFLYASVGTEINTHYLIETAFRQGKTVAIPKCFSDGVMEFYQYTGKLTEGKFRIPEPESEIVLMPDAMDLMLIPGLAFDTNGYRVGQGGGYYDRYLAQHPCIKVGLCREQFLLEEVPILWNDIPVDYVITENAVLCCKNKRSFK